MVVFNDADNILENKKPKPTASLIAGHVLVFY
jgi:hypothetical protein